MTKLYSQRYTRTSTPPLIGLERSSLLNTATTDEITNTTETPASSLYIDVFNKLNPRREILEYRPN